MGLPGKELLFDAVKGGVLTLALFLAYVTFPVIGLAAGIFTPLPAIFYFFKRGASAGVLIFVITLAVLMIMGDVSIPLFYLLQSGLTGILLPYLYLQGKGAARAIAWSVGINFLLIVALALAYGFSTEVDLQGTLMKGINSSTEQAVALYGKQGLSAEDLELFTQGIRQAGELIAKIFPALILVSLGTIAALNMAVIFRIRTTRLPEVPEPEQLHSFRNPDLLVWVVIAAGFAVLVPNPDVSRVGLNILVVCGSTYFLQGLAVVLAYFKRVSVPPLARTIFWLVLAFQPYLVMAIAILGLFDIWGDFRAPKQKNL